MALFAPPAPHTAAAYDRLAPFYDRFTAGYAYEPWVRAIEVHAFELGLRGRRALDLACGTGKSTLPLLERGYSVLGCDISEEMIDEARGKFPAHAEAFVVADMRDLPPLGEFDLVLCLDDAINYLLDDDELGAAFRGVARLLAPAGIFAFDVNSLHTYRTSFSETVVREAEQVFFVWRGETPSEAGAGELASASVEIFAQREDGLWERHHVRHRQRHHPRRRISFALERAGLRLVSTLGQHRGARLEDTADEQRHIKLVHFAKRRDIDRRDGR